MLKEAENLPAPGFDLEPISESNLLNNLVDFQIKGLRKAIAGFILSADFVVGVGERVLLSGRSGSGKTSLLRTIAGLDPLRRHDQGHFYFGSEECSKVPVHQRQIGLMFQEPTLFPNLSVLENITFGLRVRGVGKSQRENLGSQWLEKVGLKSKMESSVDHLSGGEKKRIALARVLIWKPRLILLDEPFSNLDHELKQNLRKELIELHQLWPAPMLIVSHDQEELEYFGTKRLHLEWKDDSEIRIVKSC